jgi:hypothetical protein
MACRSKPPRGSPDDEGDRVLTNHLDRLFLQFRNGRLGWKEDYRRIWM